MPKLSTKGCGLGYSGCGSATAFAPMVLGDFNPDLRWLARGSFREIFGCKDCDCGQLRDFERTRLNSTSDPHRKRLRYHDISDNLTESRTAITCLLGYGTRRLDAAARSYGWSDPLACCGAINRKLDVAPARCLLQRVELRFG
jgi:hypothetical protein